MADFHNILTAFHTQYLPYIHLKTDDNTQTQVPIIRRTKRVKECKSMLFIVPKYLAFFLTLQKVKRYNLRESAA